MKKIASIAFLLAVCVAAGRAQESRQDISLSGTALIEPFMASSTDVQVKSNAGLRRFGQLPLHAHALERARSQLRNHLPEHAFDTCVSNTNHYLVRRAPRRFRPLMCAVSTSRSSIRLSKPGQAA